MNFDFFSSPIGLGHITRDIAIAENFVGISTNFVTGGGAAKMLKSLGLPVQDVYSPPEFVVRDGELRNRARWLWRYYRYYRDCRAKSEAVIRMDSPDMVISDEDFASLAVAQKAGIPTVLVTDVLETRFTGGMASLVEKRMNRSMREIVRKSDAVIVPEEGDDQDNIKRVGPIVRGTNLSRDELRKKFSFEGKTIVISVGGTDAGVFLIRRALDAVARTRDAEAVLVSGPAVSKKFEGARNMGSVDNLHEIIFAADLLISLAGRSTIDEAGAYGTPAIFIPIRGHFEQEDNARRQGFSFEDVKRLDSLILEKLAEGRGRTSAGGAEAASRIITQTAQSNA